MDSNSPGENGEAELMVTLSKMSQDEFDVAQRALLSQYASEIERARDLTPEQAMKDAQEAFNALLPGGKVDTKDQFIMNILSDGNKVGMLHLGIRRDRKAPYAYIWDIAIDPAFRGRGYGEQAMRQAEKLALQLGLGAIALNVFGHNQPARSLYEKLGYEISAIQMTKVLPLESCNGF